MHSSLQARGPHAQYQDDDGNTKYGPDKKPKIKIKPLYLELEEGDKARFRCTVLKGRPITSIYWTKGRNDNLPSHAITDDSGLLQFDHVTFEDEKDYFCHVTNDIGTTMAQARLNVRKAGKHARKRQPKAKDEKGGINWATPEHIKHEDDKISNRSTPEKTDYDTKEGAIGNWARSKKGDADVGYTGPALNNIIKSQSSMLMDPNDHVEVDVIGTAYEHGVPLHQDENVYRDPYLAQTGDIADRSHAPLLYHDPHRVISDHSRVSSDASVAMSNETYFKYIHGIKTPSLKESTPSPIEPTPSPTPSPTPLPTPSPKEPTPPPKEPTPPPKVPTPKIPSEKSSHHTEPPKEHCCRKGIHACPIGTRVIIEKALEVLEYTQDFRYKYQVRRENDIRRQAQRRAAMKAAWEK